MITAIRSARPVRLATALVVVGALLPAILAPAPAGADQNETAGAATANFERRISAGALHTCAVLDSGAVQCWGNNAEGELGDGTTVASTVPESVTGLTAVEAVTAGSTHTCALIHGGGVSCWGNNGNGQLGDGTSTNRTAPVPVTGLGVAVAVAAGGFHTCAIVADGTVRCWGSDGSGQLGDGASGSSPTPVVVQGITTANKAVAITAGEFFTCALLADTSVACWGHNGFGQLGDGTKVDKATPVAVSGLPPTGKHVLAVTAGSSHACAAVDDGTVRCWGNDFYGQLGDNNSGSGTDQSAPVLVSGIGSANPAAGLTGGQFHTCAVLADTTLRCWGNNKRGQLGDGSTTDRKVPVTVSGVAGARAVTGGGFHTCALVGASLQCWGYDFYGQLGSSVPMSSTPVQVTAVTQALQVTAGTDVACALVGDGTATSQPYCWGSNSNGRLGAGSAVDHSTIALPVAGSPPLQASQIDAGNGQVCLLPIGSGSPSCWGFNATGQVGAPAPTDHSSPVPVSGLSNAAAVRAGGELVSATNTERGHTCAVLTTGAVSCWGRNADGQLGDNTTNDSATPVAVQSLSGASDVRPGGLHTCALTGSSVKCWGFNGSGQLGDNTTNESHVPVAVHTISTATAISTGADHSCALLSDGNVRCWGANGHGQLGDGSTTDRHEPVTVTGINTALDPAIAVAAGDEHTCALLRDNAVICWGRGSDGQLGNGSTGDAHAPVQAMAGVPSGVLSAIAPKQFVTSLSASRRDTCASLVDGSVRCWGDNSRGQLGDGIGATSTAVRTVAELGGTLNGNRIPNPVDDAATTTPGTAVVVNVLANDTDPDGPPPTLVSAADPPHGTVAVSSPTITYTPDSGYCGNDSFTYLVTDGVAQVPATVRITMNCPPTPAADAVSTPEDVPAALAVLANDTDPDGDALTVTAYDQPPHGTVVLAPDGHGQYTPSANYCGADSFGYTVDDGHGHSVVALVTVTVVCGNDPPVAGDDTAATAQGVPVSVPVLNNDTDPDASTTLSISTVGTPQHGTAAPGAGGAIDYSPATGYCGPDTFTYVVSDGSLTDTGTVSVAVTCANEGPHAAADAASVLEDTTGTIPVLTNDTDSTPGATLSISAVSSPSHGATAIAGTAVTYTPSHNYCGPDSFTYQVSDGALVDSGTVTVTVACANDPPVAVDDQVGATEDVAALFDLVANDSDPDAGDTVSLASVGAPAHGTAVVSAGKALYTPAPNYCGPDSFHYWATDGHGGTSGATAIVTVACVDDPPVIHAVADQTVSWGTDLTVLLGADDIDGPTLSYSLVSGPSGAAVSPTGTFSWTPSATDVGPAPVEVSVTDGTFSSSTTFTVNVTRRPTALVWSGPSTGQHSDPVSLAATLTDAGTGTPIAGRSVQLAVGSLATSGTTSGSGVASGSVMLTIPGGATAATAAFAADDAYGASSVSVPFTVTKETVTLTFRGSFLTLLSGASTPVSLKASVVEEADGSPSSDLGTATVTFSQLGGGVLCSAPVTPSTPGTGTATCATGALGPATRTVIVGISGPSFGGPVEVGVFTVAVAASGTASGAGQVGSGASRADFGFTAAAQRKGASGDAVQVFRSATTATVVRTSSLTSLSISCTATKPRVCSATVQGGSASTTIVNLATGALSAVVGSSSMRVDATDAAEPVNGSVPPDKYAVGITGATTYVLGAPSAQVLIGAGNVRIVS